MKLSTAVVRKTRLSKTLYGFSSSRRGPHVCIQHTSYIASKAACSSSSQLPLPSKLRFLVCSLRSQLGGHPYVVIICADMRFVWSGPLSMYLSAWPAYRNVQPIASQQASYAAVYVDHMKVSIRQSMLFSRCNQSIDSFICACACTVLNLEGFIFTCDCCPSFGRCYSA